MVDLSWSHGRLLQQLVEMGALKMRPQAGFGLCGGGAAPATGLGRDQGAVEEQLVGTWAPQLVDWLIG